MTKILSACVSVVSLFAQALPSITMDLVGALAVVLISYGFWLHYPPYGYISCGVLLLLGIAVFTWLGSAGAKSDS